MSDWKPNVQPTRRDQERVELEREVAELRLWKQDIEAQVALVMDEECGTDERHCTCVPILRREVERLREESANEVAEFNAGYECAMEGGSVHDQPSDCPYDVWEVGFAWAIWNKEKHA